MNIDQKLPEAKSLEWLKCKSTKRNMYYYHNIKTKESFWDPPEGCVYIDITIDKPDMPISNQEAKESSFDNEMSKSNLPSRTKPTQESISSDELNDEDWAMLSRPDPVVGRRILNDSTVSETHLRSQVDHSSRENFAEKPANLKHKDKEAPLKRRQSPKEDCAKRQKLACEISPEDTNNMHLPKPFDLRTKLVQRKEEISVKDPDKRETSPCDMDWEDVAENEPKENTTSKVVKARIELRSVIKSTTDPAHFQEVQNVYLVCDTNALIDDDIFVGKLISKGSFIALRIQVVIPFVVFSELDQLKLKSDVGHKARRISRLIMSSKKNSNLILQEGSKSNVPVGSLELKVNDDLVLNCALQIRESCKDGELTILMTGDNNLTNKATSFKLDTHKWNSFKVWARGYKERIRNSTLANEPIRNPLLSLPSHLPNHHNIIEDMDVDASSIFETGYPLLVEQQYNHNDEPNVLHNDFRAELRLPQSCNRQEEPKLLHYDRNEKLESSPYGSRKESGLQHSQHYIQENNQDLRLNTEMLSTEGCSDVPLSSLQQNCTRSYLDEFMPDFQSFLYNVIDEALTEEYGELKKHGNSIMPNWKLLNFVSEIRKRWFLITGSNPSEKAQEVLSKMILVIKRYNLLRSEDFTVVDVENLFTLCTRLANMFLKKYRHHTETFLSKLSALRKDWQEAYDSVSSPAVTDSLLDGDVALQPVDLALQNIHTLLQSD